MTPYVRNTPHRKPVFGLLNGGLDLAVNAFYGAETAWHVEYDAAPSKILAHHWPDVPNYGDVTQIDWDTMPPVDILTGGYPCQPFSAAGRRQGTNDERHLWPYVREAIRHLRPRYTILENVAGHRSLGFDRVLGDMAEDGLDAWWCSVRASEVGAPHQRERLFILVTPADTSGDGRERSQELHRQSHESDFFASLWNNAHRRGHTTPHADNGTGHRERARTEPREGSATPADTSGDRRDEGRPESAGIVGRHDAALGGVSPDPDVDPLHIRCGHCSHTARDHGMTRQCGICYCGEFVPPKLPPTPSAADGNGGGRYSSAGHQLPRPGAVRLLPTPEAKLANSGPDYARAVRAGSGGDDLITTAARAENTGTWGPYEAAITRAEAASGRPAPAPTEPNRNGKPRLSAAFAEWMMMLPAGWVTDIPGLSRAEQLKAIGNGVCPPQAYRALEVLHSIAVIEEVPA
ncbi:DNA methylase [Gordonia phage Gudmit]|nr:DNA methylase [Gordonia phage Gudmit]